MGFLKSFACTNDSATSTTVRIGRDCHTVLVLVDSAASIYGKLRAGRPEVVSATIRNHTGGLEDVIKRAILGDLGAWAQYGKGPILEIIPEDNDGFGYANLAATLGREQGIVQAHTGRFFQIIPIQLTLDGMCVATSAETDFVFTFEGLVRGTNYDFYCLEGETTGTNILKYENINILQDQHERKVDVDALAGLVMPATSSYKRLLLTYGTGNVAKYDISELRFMSLQKNRIEVERTTYSGNSTRVITSGPMNSDVLVMPLHSLSQIEMDTDGSALQFLAVSNRSRLVVA